MYGSAARQKCLCSIALFYFQFCPFSQFGTPSPLAYCIQIKHAHHGSCGKARSHNNMIISAVVEMGRGEREREKRRTQLASSIASTQRRVPLTIVVAFTK